MTIPAAAGKTNVDQGASDTPAAGRQDIEGLIDKFNVLRTHLLGSAITSTPATVGDGLEVASNALRVKADGSSIAVSSNGIKIAPGAVRQVGEMTDYLGTTAPTGWIFADGRTIGSATSDATNRANADTEALFTLLWDSYADSILAVSSGRGANAAADFAANKTIVVPDLRGRVTAGKDNMGGAAASRLTSGSAAGIDGTTLGASGGVEEHQLTVSEMPAHTHPPASGNFWSSSGGSNTFDTTLPSSARGNNATGSTGGDAAHNNMPPAWVVNKIIKL